MSEHCNTCNKPADSYCWNNHLGWCPEHQISFPSEYSTNDSPPLGTPCPSCLNNEWAASEAYAQAQADSVEATRNLEKARQKLSYSLAKRGGQYGGMPDHELLVAIENAEKIVRDREVGRVETYKRYHEVITTRAASQKQKSR